MVRSLGAEPQRHEGLTIPSGHGGLRAPYSVPTPGRSASGLLELPPFAACPYLDIALLPYPAGDKMRDGQWEVFVRSNDRVDTLSRHPKKRRDLSNADEVLRHRRILRLTSDNGDDTLSVDNSSGPGDAETSRGLAGT